MLQDIAIKFINTATQHRVYSVQPSFACDHVIFIHPPSAPPRKKSRSCVILVSTVCTALIVLIPFSRLNLLMPKPQKHKMDPEEEIEGFRVVVESLGR